MNNTIDVLKQIIQNPRVLSWYTLEKLKRALEEAGYELKPLNRGSLKGILFEKGGGYKVNFDGNGILQYHPRTFSHHKEAYYKIATAAGGKHRYDIYGNEKSI